jgi:hypothetical protein
MSAPLGRNLVFDMNCCGTDLLVLTDCASDVVHTAVSRVTVCDDGEVGRINDTLRVLDHLAHVNDFEVRKAELSEDRRVSGHVSGVVTCHLCEAGVERVVKTGREDVVLVVELLAQLARLVVVYVPVRVVVFVTSLSLWHRFT